MDEWKLVPREPTWDMLAAASPFPEHLRREHPDPDDPWHLKMEAATKTDQLACLSIWRKMIAAAPPAPSEAQNAAGEQPDISDLIDQHPIGRPMSRTKHHPAPAAAAPDEVRLREALNKIYKLHPEMNSPEGFNEWGEADCFRQAQEIARKALSDPA